MSGIDSRIPTDWFTRAERDLAAARHLLSEEESDFVLPAAMLLQQAVEKYLKGYLLSRGQKLKRTHDLLELLDEALPDTPELAQYDAACIKITEYYTEQSYPPLVTSDLSNEEVLQSMVEASELITVIKRRVIT